MKLQLLFLSLLIYFASSTPIRSETSLFQSPSLTLSASSAHSANFTSLNTSSASNTSLTDRRFLPYHFRVPTTAIVLHLGFGIFRHRIDPAELRSLLLLTRDGIQHGINVHGRDALFPAMGDNHRQQFSEHGLGTVQLDVSDFRAGNQFSWGDLWNVVEGLRLYLLEGGRSFETHFTFWEEPEAVSHRLHRKLGQGRIVRGSPNVEKV